MRIIDLNAAIADGLHATPMALFTVIDSVMIDGIRFGSTLSINGPESDWFVVTDECVTLAFGAPGCYRLQVSSDENTSIRCALQVI